MPSTAPGVIINQESPRCWSVIQGMIRARRFQVDAFYPGKSVSNGP